MMRISLSLGIALAVAVSATDPAQTPLIASSPPDGAVHSGTVIDKSFSAWVQQIMDGVTIPGLSLAVVRPDGEVELGAWGKRTEEGDDLAPDNLFTIASCSKAFLSASMGILMDDFATGRNVTSLPGNVKAFDWQTKVKDLLPQDWVLEDEWAQEKANIKDILSHVSGLPRHDNSYSRSDSPESAIKRLRYLRPAFELRQQWSYNNLMYITGSHIISLYSGMRYTDFVAERVFKPLNMTSSTFYPNQALKSGKFSESWTKHGRRIPHWFGDENDGKVVEFSAGAGGVISSAEDLIKWVKTLLNKGANSSNDTIIPMTVYDETTSASAVVYGKPIIPNVSIVGYGMGWMRGSYKGHDFVQHSGGIPGISTLVTFLPDAQTGVVVLANADEKAAQNLNVTMAVLDKVLGLASHENDVNEIENSLFKATEKTQKDSEFATVAHVPETTLSLVDYAGTYTDRGYGSFTLCAPESTSLYCLQTLADFATVDRAYDRSSSAEQKQLVAAWPRVWTDHLRLTPRAGDTPHAFDLQLTALFPEGYGKNTTAFETSETGESEAVATFVVDEATGKVKGMGLSGFVGQTTERERLNPGGSVEERAEVWFEKI